jgi:hypothetical protein
MSTQEIADLNNAVEAPAVQCPCCAPYVESDPERVQCSCRFQSLHALEIAASKYAWDVRANACRVDFAPATFHAIVSCFFWEHMRPPDKDLLLERSSRWLRPGREVVLLFDVASRNPLFTRARRHPCESC